MDSEQVYLPESIRELTAGKPYRSEDIGISGSRVLVYDDSVLNIERYRKENEETVRMMRWLEGKLPVPRVIRFEQDAEYQYLLMSRVSGCMSCDRYYLEHPRELLELLAEALRMFWRTDIFGCPRSRDLDTELKEARERVAGGLVRADNMEPGTLGEGGFRDPEELLRWLENNRPDQDPVLSHGDFCLPNILIDQGRISGFIDLGNTGVADRWRDIALCYRSLKHNFDGTYGGKVYPDFSPEALFDALGIEPDREKLRYYVLLDELF